jgi:hypothetical protein
MTLRQITMAIAALATATVGGCGWQPDRVAVISLDVGGRAVYIKRQDWGLNGLAVALSMTPEWRQVRSPDDYTWCCDTPPIPLFRVEGGALHLWETSREAWRAPTRASFPVPVAIHVVDQLTFIQMTRDPESHGVRKLGLLDWPLREPPGSVVPFGKIAHAEHLQGVSPQKRWWKF